MTAGDDRVRMMLERAFGALSDWLELVRAHEQERREALARHRMRRREQAVALATAAACAALAILFAAGSRADILG